MWHVCGGPGGEKRNACRVFVGKSEGNRPVVGREARRDEATSEGDQRVNVPRDTAVCVPMLLCVNPLAPELFLFNFSTPCI